MKDRELLAAILDAEISASERDAFQSMLDHGRALTKLQLEWAKSVWARVGHGDYVNLVSSGQVPMTSRAPLGYEMLPRPLKPPGVR